MLNEQAIGAFQDTVYDYFQHHGRDMPWRKPEANGSFDPYKIMVSEIMLQQTQVPRVIPKFEAFMAEFPDVKVLAEAPLSKVLEQWSGLGYNRRAKFLHQAAQQITEEYQSQFPQTLNMLTKLSGVGQNTAAAILVYAFNMPEPFLETNIRTVYIHHFFLDHPELVTDKQLLPLVTETIDQEQPREWFWALMDYGSYLKSSVGNLSRQSKHYTKQSTFKGSKRQIRGQIIKLLTNKPQTLKALQQTITDERLAEVLQDLTKEQLISKRGRSYFLGL
jgi:A/G-specific adenine glycosylase